MQGEIVPYKGGRLTLAEVERVAEMAVASLLFGNFISKPKAAMAILMGQELGLPPATALASIHVIDDKPAVSANLMIALVKRSRPRYDLKITRRDDDGATVEWYQDGEVWGVSTFDEADARQAGLIPPIPNSWSPDKKQKWPKSGWAKYPKAMYVARAVAAGFRMYAGDLALGGNLYATEEFEDRLNPEDSRLGGDVIDIPVEDVNVVKKKSLQYTIDEVAQESPQVVS